MQELHSHKEKSPPMHCFCLQKKGEKLNNSGWSDEGLTNLLKYYFVLLACSFIHVVEKLINSTQPNVTSS